ncbi:hypothetical protein [Glaciibacter superstes]|uniref:hypothetical protein n=1 Tax=Glaciibacter superstes TaxID=501023 RepID=UPI0003B66F57|nr:hypothetical protein [Glaciibacter superstes]
MIVAALPAHPDPVWGLGLGATVFLIASGAVWGSVHLRENAHDNWARKVDVAFAGLQERATDIFEELRNAIDAVVPPAGAPFDPKTVVADPAPVGKLAKYAVKVLKERMRIRRQFKTFLVICSIAKWLSFVFAGAVFISTALYFFQYANTLLWQTASWIAASIFGLGVVVVILYSGIEGRLQQSYEHSGSTLEMGAT